MAGVLSIGATMDLAAILRLANALGPYAPRITRGIQTVERLMKDQGVQDLVVLAKELTPIVEAALSPPAVQPEK